MILIAGECSYQRQAAGPITEHRFTWVSNASGNVTVLQIPLTGVLWRLKTKPVSAPTDNYDITILDDAGIDILLGKGVDRDTAAAEMTFVVGSTGELNATHGAHSLYITNAGNGKAGYLILSMIEGRGYMPGT